MLTFPVHLFNPDSITLKLAGAVITGGESLSGEVDTIKTDGGGYWMIQMADIQLLDDDQLRAWQAWEDYLDGGVQRVLVPVPELRTAPRPIAGGVLSSPSQLATTSDDPYFPEALAFGVPWIIATIEGAAALRATQITIDVERGARLKGGERFALTHAVSGRRVYRVMRVLSKAGQLATVNIRPPLREAVVDEQAVDFDWPSMVATMMPDQDISPRIERGRTARVSIAFRESF